MKIKIRLFNLLFVLTVFSVACSVGSCVNHDLSGSCNALEPVNFTNEIKPIINTKCAIPGCHNGDNGPNLNWTDFSNFSRSKFEVKRRINLPSTDGDKMPQIGELSSEQVRLITCWVEQGGLNN